MSRKKRNPKSDWHLSDEAYEDMLYEEKARKVKKRLNKNEKERET